MVNEFFEQIFKDIKGMNPIYAGDSLTFHPAPPTGPNIHESNTSVHEIKDWDFKAYLL